MTDGGVGDEVHDGDRDDYDYAAATAAQNEDDDAAAHEKIVIMTGKILVTVTVVR